MPAIPTEPTITSAEAHEIGNMISLLCAKYGAFETLATAMIVAGQLAGYEVAETEAGSYELRRVEP